MMPEAGGNRYYFVSDVHLGSRCTDRAAVEKKFLRFLDQVSSDGAALYLLGDIFDFWYEYRYVIPRGYTRVLGRLAQLCDSGVKVYFIPGNHDVWAYGYFEQEIGMKILTQPQVVEIGEKRFCIGHGDGLGKTDAGFRFIRWMFHNHFLQMLFSTLHPRWALGIGYAWAGHSRKMKSGADEKKYSFKGTASPIWHFADDFGREYGQRSGKKIDYYIFGHFHTPAQLDVASGGRLYILGEWSRGGEYAVFDGISIAYNPFLPWRQVPEDFSRK